MIMLSTWSHDPLLVLAVSIFATGLFFMAFAPYGLWWWNRRKP